MDDRNDGRERRRLAAGAIAMLAAAMAGELYRHLGVEPVAPPPTLLFEMLEVVLLAGAAVACTLLILRVRVRATGAAAAAMFALLLAGELYLGDKAATPWRLLVELLEAALLVGGSIACALVARRGGWAAGTGRGYGTPASDPEAEGRAAPGGDGASSPHGQARSMVGGRLGTARAVAAREPVSAAASRLDRRRPTVPFLLTDGTVESRRP